MAAAKTTGVRAKHSRPCVREQRERGDDTCRCRPGPSYEGHVWDKRRGVKVSRTFSGRGALAAAKQWRTDALHGQARGRGPRPRTRTTVYEAAVDLVAGMKDGSIRSARRQPYRPSTVRSYERCLGVGPNWRERAPERVCERLGDLALSDLERRDVQEYVDRLAAAGWDASTIGGQLDPLRALLRRARQRDEIGHDPMAGLDLPRPEGRRDRVADPDEAERLIAALPEDQRALWATLLYAGLRRGEARALRVRDVDLDARELHVRRVWDDVERELSGAKTEAGRRTLPIFAPLAEELGRHLLRTGRRGRPDALLFGRTDTEAFEPSTLRRQAREAWAAAGLKPITPHECRHSCASVWIALGITNPKAICEWMGHANVAMTFDLYGHLLDGAREQAVAQADAAWAARREVAG